MSETDEDYSIVEWEWSHIICGCRNPTYARNFPDPTDNSTCSTCGKLARWQFLDCAGCGEKYLFVFKHHARKIGLMDGKYGKIRDKSKDGWALDKRLCWDCICEVSPAIEGDIPPRKIRPMVVRDFDEIDRTLPKKPVFNLED